MKHPPSSLLTTIKPISTALFPELFCDTVRQFPDRVAISASAHDTPSEGRPCGGLYAGDREEQLPRQSSHSSGQSSHSSGQSSHSLFSETSYEELLAMSLHIAGFLQSKGIGREDVVALVMPKSHLLVASILGVWFAGAAILPIDPRNSEAKLVGLLRSAPVKAMLTRYRTVQPTDIPCFAVGDALAHAEPLPQPVPLTADSLAYVLFTSGTAGVPLGVMIEHGGLSTVLQVHRDVFGLEPGDNFSWYLSHTFDASISNLGATLLSGATLHIPSVDAQESTLVQLGEMRARNITHIDLPPSLLPSFNADEAPLSLKTVVIGGEMCSPQSVRQWAQKVRLINAYGLPEATICSSMLACAPDWNSQRIGEPLPGVLFRISDEEGRDVLSGEPGELWIGGPSVARGYCNHPLLTSQRFVTINGSRWHRTGDRVVERPNGEIEFLGKLERQIKRRGLLIEPEEIESAMLAHPGVRRAAIVERPVESLTNADNNTPKLEIVGFYEIHPGGPTPEVLRSHLKTRLPEWMIPRRFMILGDIPRTTSAKTDFEKLKSIALEATDKTDITDLELLSITRLLRICWEQTLGIKDIPKDVSFFELGGELADVAKLVALASKRGLPLTPSLITEAPTLDQQSRALKMLNIDRHSYQWKRISEEAEHIPRVVCSSSYFAGKARDKGATLITGASGSFGAHLLAELLAISDAPVICIVRGPNARRRLEASLAQWSVKGFNLPMDRVRVIPGDLQLYRFGLSRSDWSELASTVESILHCGATVNLLTPFDGLVAANIGSTRSVAELAVLARAHITYLSSLAVFTHDKNPPSFCDEEDTLETPRELRSGYAATKVASERLLRKVCSLEGLPLTVIRPGLLVGDVVRASDTLPILIRGMVQLGMVPDDLLNVYGIDAIPLAAGVETALRASRGVLSGTFHISQSVPIPLAVLHREIAREHPVEIVSREEFNTWMECVPSDRMSAEASLTREVLLAPRESVPMLTPVHTSFSQRSRFLNPDLAAIRIPPPEVIVRTLVESCFSDGESETTTNGTLVPVDTLT